MTQIIRATAKGQLVPIVFAQDAVAASQTDADLRIMEVASAAGLTVTDMEMPFDGEIIGLSYSLDDAGTTGSLAIGGTINGAEDADTTLTVTTDQRGYKRIPRGKAGFNAGDYVGAQITTSADWAPATSDLGVTLWVLLYLDEV